MTQRDKTRKAEYDREYRSFNRERKQEYQKAYYQRNRKTITEKDRVAQRNRNLKSKYGITSAIWDALFTSQACACAICHCTTAARWVTDHCHSSSKVRGILCNPCNIAIGLLEDNSNRMRAAAEYVERHA